MKKIYSKKDNSVVESIKNNDTNTLKLLYKANYHKIEALVLKNSGTKEHAKDVFQDAFITVWKNVKSNKFNPQDNNSLNGYLYTISKNKWMDYLRSNRFKKTTAASKIVNFDFSDNNSTEDNDDILKEKRLQDVMYAFGNLEATCKSLLTKFYFEKKSMNTIAKELQLHPASTRNKKYRCMQKLKALVLKSEK